MMNGVSRIAALAAAIFTAGSLSAAEEVLYWMVDGTAEVDDHGTKSSVSDFLPAETADSWSAARIRVTGGDITGDVFLDVYDSDGTLQVGSGALGIAFGETESGGYWGAGVPTGNQSPVGSYSSGTPEYSFVIELGNVSWDGNAASWVETVAVSKSAAYSDISRYIHTSFDPNPTSGAVWAPTSYNVPEPSGGLLMLVGGALLALRRRKWGR